MKLKQPVLITGSSGLVASHLTHIYQDKYEFEYMDISNKKNPVDITSYQSILNAVNQSRAKVLIHFAAFTDVNQAHSQDGDTTGLAYQVNVVGTSNLVKVCSQNQIHLIHISTAYVFDGNKSTPYTEQDLPSPIEWYGKTKWLAEQKVMESNACWSILRIDQPFGTLKHKKLDILHQIINKLNENSLPPQFTNHFFGPTFINDFAKIIDWTIRTRSTGLYHATNGESWNDFDFSTLVRQSAKLNNKIRQGDLFNYLRTAKRPYQLNTALNIDKLLSKLDFNLTPITQAVRQCLT